MLTSKVAFQLNKINTVIFFLILLSLEKNNIKMVSILCGFGLIYNLIGIIYRVTNYIF